MSWIKFISGGVWLLVLIAVVSCGTQPSGGGGSGGGGGALSTQLSGTITVSDTNFWSKIRVGIFSNTITNENDDLGFHPWVFSTNLYYYSSNESGLKSFAPVSLGTINGSDSNTNRTFTVDLVLALNNLYYFVGIWYDANDNTNWEITNKDMNFSGSVESERFVLPQLNIVSGSKTYTNAVVKNYISGNYYSQPGITYAISGFHPDGNYNYVLELKDSMKTGFQFYLSKTNY